VQGDPGPGDGRRARAAVGLQDVAVDRDLALARKGIGELVSLQKLTVS
jgi:hypothetical protein